MDRMVALGSGPGEKGKWRKKFCVRRNMTDGRKLGRRHENHPHSDTVYEGREEERETGS